jgi:hypothetical protein
MVMTGKSRIMIYGPKNDGTYVVEFRTAAGEALHGAGAGKACNKLPRGVRRPFGLSVRRFLRPAGRRVFEVLLPPIGRHVE